MAFDPINYSVDVGDPFKSAIQGYQVGNAIIQQQQAQSQAQQQAAAQQQMRADLNEVANNPNASGADYAGLITRYPQLSEQLKRGWDVLDSQQKQTRLDQAGQVYAALSSGNNDIAKDLFKGIADAAKNSGNQREADHAEAMQRLIDINPAAVKSQIGMSLISQTGPEKFAEAFGKFGTEQRAQEQAPFDLAEKRAKAEQEAVKAKYADSVALQEIEKRGWDIKKVISDIGIDKENSRIRAMEASLKREENDLKRQELQLKIADAKTAREDKIREKVSGAESAASTIDNMLNTADRVLKNPALNSVLGSVQGRLPAVLSDDASDAIELIDTLGSQSFLSQLPSMKGLGALSEKEGEKLQSALTNLSRKQSEQQFRYNLNEAQRLMLKARENLSEKTGVPLGAPDRPNAPRINQDFAGSQTSVPGMIAPGNINLNNRPIVKNEDGSISTVRSIGVNIDGKEYLLPTVSDSGKIMTDRQAIENFKKTGKHLGIFESPQSSTAYAESLHRQQENQYVSPNQRLTQGPQKNVVVDF